MKKKYSTPEFDLGELFANGDQRKLGISAFLNLQRTNGWNLMTQLINNQIDKLTEQILIGLDGGEKTAEAKLYYRDRLINERKVLTGILELPKFIIEQLKDETKEDLSFEELDPYDKPVDNPL